MKIKSTINKNAIKAVGLNLLYLSMMLLLFEPVWTVDECVISNTLYGAFGNTYDYHTEYISFLYGRIVTFFLNLCPNLPWYTILDYLWIFVALSLLVFLILEWHDDDIGLIMAHMLLLFFCYEGYICIQFTKTAAIIGGIGFFAIMAKKRSIPVRCLGICGVILASLMRYKVMVMATGAWVCAIIIQAILVAFNEKKIELKNFAKYFVCICAISALAFTVNTVSEYAAKENTAWQQYTTWTSMRSMLLDYGMPSYAQNQDAYRDLEVSENDLKVWYSWNHDPNVATNEVFGEIIDLQEGELEGFFKRIFDFNNIREFFNIFPLVFSTIDVFFCLGILMFLGWHADIKQKPAVYVLVFGVLLLFNYYLFINGRYLKHRVDIGIILNICLLFLFLLSGYIGIKHFDKSTKHMILGGIFCLLLLVPTAVYGDDQNGADAAAVKANRLFFQNTSTDESHYYVFVNDRNNSQEKYISWGAFDVVSIGFFKNIYGVTNPSPVVIDTLKEYGIKNPYTDLVDNEEMFLVFTAEDLLKDEIELYIEEHTGKDVDLILVKNYLNKHIYRVNSRQITEYLSFDSVNTATDCIHKNVQSQIEDQWFSASGYAYVEGKNDFQQNIYVEVVDSKTNERELYYTQQFCNAEFGSMEEGRYSGFNVSFELPEFYDDSDDIFIIVENEKEAYKFTLVPDR